MATTALSFESFYDRIAAALGFEQRPAGRLVVALLRAQQPVQGDAPDLAAHGRVPDFQHGLPKKGPGLFAAGAGHIPVVTFLATARFMVNQFGYLGGGYRRCFLLPVDPRVILRTGSYASMILGAIFIPAGAIVWAIFAPRPVRRAAGFDARASATAGLFLFHAIGLWTTLYGARRGNYNQSFGNDLSLLANIAIIGGVMACMFGPMMAPQVLRRRSSIRRTGGCGSPRRSSRPVFYSGVAPRDFRTCWAANANS